MPATQTMTAQEFLERPLREDSGIECLVEGELVLTHPTARHQSLVLRIAHDIESWIESGTGHGLVSIPIDVGIDARNVYAPDISWYRRTLAEDAEPPYPVPDIAAEVRSPSTWRYDIGAKRNGYERHGLQELWLVDTPANAVLVFRRSKPDAPRFDVAIELGLGDALESPLLPGFSLPLERLFRP